MTYRRTYGIFRSIKKGSRAAPIGRLSPMATRSRAPHSGTIRPTAQILFTCHKKEVFSDVTSMEEGGARYNVGAVSMISTVDAGNSMTAIKKLVTLSWIVLSPLS